MILPRRPFGVVLFLFGLAGWGSQPTPSRANHTGNQYTVNNPVAPSAASNPSTAGSGGGEQAHPTLGKARLGSVDLQCRCCPCGYVDLLPPGFRDWCSFRGPTRGQVRRQISVDSETTKYTEIEIHDFSLYRLETPSCLMQVGVPKRHPLQEQPIIPTSMPGAPHGKDPPTLLPLLLLLRGTILLPAVLERRRHNQVSRSLLTPVASPVAAGAFVGGVVGGDWGRGRGGFYPARG